MGREIAPPRGALANSELLAGPRPSPRHMVLSPVCREYSRCYATCGGTMQPLHRTGSMSLGW
jgi:hypothetical protein